MRGGFFNSIDGDRKYNADLMNMPYKNLISNGVFPNPSTNLQVLTSTGLTVQILEGGGLFGGKWGYNDAPVLLTLDAAPTNLNRRDAIIVKCDNTEPVRATSIEIKKGTPASNPVAPTMERSDYISEYCLATVYLASGTNTITQSMITDSRADNNVCGWVTGLIDQVDTSTLFLQWQKAYEEQFAANTAAFNAWFSALQGVLSDDESAGAELIRLREYKADKEFYSIALTAGGWALSGGYYTQTVTAEGVGENDLIIVSPAVASADTWAANAVLCTEQAEGSLTFRANAATAVTANVINLGNMI